MSDQTTTAPSVATHGASSLPEVEVDSYNLELKDDEGLLGDRANKGAFRAILERWRKPLRKAGSAYEITLPQALLRAENTPVQMRWVEGLQWWEEKGQPALVPRPRSSATPSTATSSPQPQQRIILVLRMGEVWQHWGWIVF